MPSVKKPSTKKMARPKVSPAARQRTLVACESCKRRKQKCNGLQPCSRCSELHNVCTYAGTADGGPPPENLLIHEGANRTRTPSKHGLNGPSDNTPIQKRRRIGDDQVPIPLQPGEAEQLYNNARILMDSRGNHVYIGDSANLAYLQMLRIMVGSVGLKTHFTDDPQRHRLLEQSFVRDSTSRVPLPNLEETITLAESFFIHTKGFIQIFDRDEFIHMIHTYYAKPIAFAKHDHWAVMLNLVLAIGLAMTNFPITSKQGKVILALRRDGGENLDEAFYFAAKERLTRPDEPAIETVQSLLLQSYYLLIKCMRTAAYAQLGLAVRNAYAIGLHHEETRSAFPPDMKLSRSQLWRSLFVIDCFLSLSLGRPAAINLEDCRGNDLHLRHEFNHGDKTLDIGHSDYMRRIGTDAIVAAVRASTNINKALKGIYSGDRRFTMHTVQQIADECKQWTKVLPPTLHHSNLGNLKLPPAHSVAVLNVNMLYCHSLLLLTRPLFLLVLNDEIHQDIAHRETGIRPPRRYFRMEKYGHACVTCAAHTVLLVHKAYKGDILSRRSPLVLYCVFAAALVLIANEFAALFYNAEAQKAIPLAINLMEYCGELDPQAKRLQWILTAFRGDVLTRLQERARELHLAPMEAPAPTDGSVGQQPHRYAIVNSQAWMDQQPKAPAARMTTENAHMDLMTLDDPTDGMNGHATRGFEDSSMPAINVADVDDWVDMETLWLWPTPEAPVKVQEDAREGSLFVDDSTVGQRGTSRSRHNSAAHIDLENTPQQPGHEHQENAATADALMQLANAARNDAADDLNDF